MTDTSRSRSHADKILSMLKQADADGKHLFIILTGGICTGKTTVSNIISDEYPSFSCSSDISAYFMFTYSPREYVNCWLKTYHWGDGLAMIDYRRGDDVSRVPSLVYMIGHKFEGYKYRRLYHNAEPVTPCHILCVMDEESFMAFNSLPINGPYSKFIQVYTLDHDYRLE